MPKILHTADLRLGAKFLGLGRAGDKVRAQLKRSWTAVIETAIAEKVDAVIVAGGLFDSSEVSRPAIEFILKEIARLGKVPVVMVPGMCDHLGKGSLYYHFDLIERPENLFVIVTPNETLKLKELNLAVIGCPAFGPKSKESPLSGVRAPKDGFSVIVAAGTWHGDNHPISESEIAKTGAHYVALGGEPSFKSGVGGEITYAFSGPPEATSFSVSGAAGIVIVDLAKKPVTAEFQPLGVLVWKQETASSVESLKNLLERERGENRLLQGRLTGEHQTGFFELDETIKGFKDQFLFLNIKDERKFTADKAQFPLQTVAGQFIHLVEENLKKSRPEEKEFYQEVLSLGTSLASPISKE